MACLHFAKDVPRMQRDKAASRWNKYIVDELRWAALPAPPAPVRGCCHGAWG